MVHSDRLDKVEFVLRIKLLRLQSLLNKRMCIVHKQNHRTVFNSIWEIVNMKQNNNGPLYPVAYQQLIKSATDETQGQTGNDPINNSILVHFAQ